MATRTPLSRERIIGTAVEMLDAGGEAGLTFRALGAQLRTGPGAIYWHVANKHELLVAATDAVLAGTFPAGQDSPVATIRTIALGIFDAIRMHPWIGTQLSGVVSGSTTLQLFERIGRQVQALGVPASAQFNAASAVWAYIRGVAGQNAADARTQKGARRSDVLAREAAIWSGLDAAEFPFLCSVAGPMREHDDREQFLAGLDLILAGIRSV